MMAGLKYNCDAFSMVMNRDYISGKISNTSETEINESNVILNPKDCLVLPLHRCPSTVFGFYSRLRNHNQVIQKILAQSSKHKPSDRISQYFTTFHLQFKSKSHVRKCIEQHDPGSSFRICGRKVYPLVGYLLNNSNIEEIKKSYNGHPFFKMFTYHCLCILHFLSFEKILAAGRQSNLQIESNTIEVREIMSKTHKTSKLLTGSCEIYETFQEFECILKLGNKTWIEISKDPTMPNLMTSLNIMGQRVNNLKTTVKIRTYSFRFEPRISCHDTFLERTDKLTDCEILLAQDITFCDSLYRDMNNDTQNVCQPLDDNYFPISFNLQTVNRGLLHKDKMGKHRHVEAIKESAGSQPMQTDKQSEGSEGSQPMQTDKQSQESFATDDGHCKLLLFVFNYGMPMQLEIQKNITNAKNFDFPVELTCANILKAFEKLISASRTSTEDLAYKNIKGHIFPYNLAGTEDMSKAIMDSLGKNFQKKHDNKQLNKNETWQLHPQTKCKQTFGCLVQGPIFKNIMFTSRASSVTLYVEVGDKNCNSIAPVWDFTLTKEDDSGKLDPHASVFTSQEIDLNDVLRAASQLSIFDDPLYM